MKTPKGGEGLLANVVPVEERVDERTPVGAGGACD